MKIYPDSKSVHFTRPMSRNASELFLLAVSLDFPEPVEKVEGLEEGDYPLSAMIIKKRVEALKLPISFSISGLLALAALADNPGKAVVGLCDCLSAFEGQEVTAGKVAGLYPWGFYNDEAFVGIIDGWMKTGKHKWAHIY